jgi:transposase-like protein
VADAYLSGKQTMQQLAVKNGVAVQTVRDWVRARRDTFMIDHEQKPVGTRHDRTDEPSLATGVYGTGGNMTDDSVRRATRNLEKAIVAGLKKRGLAPLVYRKGGEA